MIDFISGVIADKSPGRVVVQNNGIGYNLQISVNTYEHLPHPGETVNLKTYLHVREDNIQLYAFSQEVERKVFLGLISVSGIGPKMAVGILSGIKVYELIQAIQHGDEQRLNGVVHQGEVDVGAQRAEGLRRRALGRLRHDQLGDVRHPRHDAQEADVGIAGDVLRPAHGIIEGLEQERQRQTQEETDGK